MPSRIIRDCCRTSKSLDSLSDAAERLFWRLITVADDHGRFEADTCIVLGDCFPRRIGTMKLKAIERSVQEIVAAGPIRLYRANGRRYGLFTSWFKYQRRRSQQSKFPEPTSSHEVTEPAPESEEGKNIGVAATRRNLPQAAAERRLVIGDRVKGKGYGSVQQDVGFQAFWTAYPRKDAKEEALKAWGQTTDVRPDTAVLVAAIGSQVVTNRWTRGRRKWIPLPASWLRGKRWTDEVDGDPAAEDMEPV